MLLAVIAALAAGPTDPPDNLDFHRGTLAGWECTGAFAVTAGSRHGPSLHFGVSSSDRGQPGRTGLLHRVLVVPPGAGVIRFSAYAARPKGCPADENLDVLLLGPDNRVVPKQVRAGDEWKPAAHVLPPDGGRAREYVWQVAAYAGQALRLVVADEDKRPGCHVWCTGFRVAAAGEFEFGEFRRFMLRLVREKRLGPVARFDSKHFTAISTADDRFTAVRLHNGELMYQLFLDHFRRKGFRLEEPAGKLHLAVLDSQAAFEAYLGFRVPPSLVGVYHKGTNRLVVYDYGWNQGFLAQRHRAEQEARRVRSDLDRFRTVDTVNRRAEEFRTEMNIAVVMHEVAHQLSFNTGLLNRAGDVPVWLAEGLACYCEPTVNGAWQGLGEPNPQRLAALAAAARDRGRFFRVRDLVAGDDWLRQGASDADVLLGYAQSWVLFRLLMEDRPGDLRRYLEAIYERRTPDHRLTDFAEAFGPNLDRLEVRYREYLRQLLESYQPPR